MKRKHGEEDRVARTERESDRRRREEKWQTCWCCQDQQRACRMAQASAEKLEHTGPAEKERVPRCHRVLRTELESDRRRREVAGLLMLLRLAKSLQNGADFSRKT